MVELGSFNSLSSPMSTVEYVTNVGLYKTFDFTAETAEPVFNMVFSSETIDVYCPECRRMSTFKPNRRKFPRDSESSVEDPLYLSADQWVATILPWGDEEITNEWTCTRRHHSIRIYALLEPTKNGFRIQKVGQFPSIADLNEYEIEQYEKILGKHYREYNTAVGLVSHGVGVGSFVYLRRILENFVIKPAIEKAISEGKYKSEDFANQRVRHRISMIKAELPKFFVENTPLYSILSKGIHELSDKECLEFFPVMHDAMLLILSQIQAARDVQDREKTLKEAITKLADRHK